MQYNKFTVIKISFYKIIFPFYSLCKRKKKGERFRHFGSQVKSELLRRLRTKEPSSHNYEAKNKVVNVS